MIEDLRRLIYIYRHSSISKAAKASGLTQPAVSQSLKRLENALKTKLIVRTTRDFYFTEDGKSVYQMAEKVINIWDSMRDPKLRNQKLKSYSIGLFDNAAIRLARNENLFSNKIYTVDLIIENSANLKR